MTHALYEVFEDPAPFAGKKWAVQFPKGIMTFRTKRTAVQVAAMAQGGRAGGAMKQLECQRCGHTWMPRKPQKPPVCAKCKRADWSKAKGAVNA